MTPDLRTALLAAGVSTVDELRRVVDKEILSLLADGKLSFHSDREIGGVELEWRVKLLLRSIGLSVNDGPPNAHDATVAPPTGAYESVPLVLEIKSGKAPSPSRDDLRQLDDWVFDLSGEEHARKTGLRGIDEFIRRHPSRHKGVMVFNGPTGQPFPQRAATWLGPNELAFADKHNLCVVRFDMLLAWCDAVTGQRRQLDELWTAIHKTAGTLGAPP